MITHVELGTTKFTRLRQLKTLINQGAIKLGGNANLKIYGTLDCKLGKRLKTKNRIFCMNEVAASEKGYRPCGHCMRVKYKLWKANNC